MRKKAKPKKKRSVSKQGDSLQKRSRVWIAHHKIGMSITLTSLIIALIIIWFLTLQFRFLVGDELNIEVSPASLSIEQVSTDEAQIRFSVTNRNFQNCRTSCRFRLIDLSDMKILDEQNRTLVHLDVFEYAHTLPAPGIGSGEHLYQFETRCNNLKSTLCPTPGEPRTQTALIVQEYSRSPTEKQLIAEVEPRLRAYLDTVIDLRSRFSVLEQYITRLPPTGANIRKEAQSIPIDTLLEEASTKQEAWNDQAFSAADPVLDPTPHVATVENLISQAVNILERRTASIEILQTLDKDMLSEASLFLNNETNRNNIQTLTDLERFSRALVASIEAFNSSQAEESDIFESINSSRVGIDKNLLIYKKQILELNKAKDDLERALLNKGVPVTVNGTLCDSLQGLIEAATLVNTKSSTLRQTNFSFTFSEPYLSELKVISGLLSNQNLSFTTPQNLSVEETLDIVMINLTNPKSILSRECKEFELDPFKLPGINNLLSMDLSKIISPDVTSPEGELLSFPLDDPVDTCCSLKSCGECSKIPPTPVIFIHGHSLNEKNTPESSLNAFAKIQDELQDDGFLNAGVLDLTDTSVPPGSWGRSSAPVSVRATYYYISHYSVGEYELTTRKSERIENYALRLHDIIRIVKDRTGSDQVDVVAHSMGGLVAREYMTLFGARDIHKLVLVNTPNKGVVDQVSSFCTVLGSARECEELAEGSIFLERLNSIPIPEGADVHAIRSIGCEMDGGEGDGIVLDQNARLDGAENYLIRGNCTDALGTDLHTKALDPDIYPATKDLILTILSD